MSPYVEGILIGASTGRWTIVRQVIHRSARQSRGDDTDATIEAETFYRTIGRTKGDAWTASVTVGSKGSVMLEIEESKYGARLSCSLPLSPGRVRELRRILADALVQAGEPVDEMDPLRPSNVSS